MTQDNSGATGQSRLAHSHAHEGDIPGTVDLSAVEGDDTAYGQALYPVPAEDPNDPLQVSGISSPHLEGAGSYSDISMNTWSVRLTGHIAVAELEEKYHFDHRFRLFVSWE